MIFMLCAPPRHAPPRHIPHTTKSPCVPALSPFYGVRYRTGLCRQPTRDRLRGRVLPVSFVFSLLPGNFRALPKKNSTFFEMSAQKIFRKGEPNRVNQPKPHMNLLVQDPLSKTGFSGPFVVFPNSPEFENRADQPMPRISRETMDAFSEAKSGHAHGGQFCLPPAR